MYRPTRLISLIVASAILAVNPTIGEEVSWPQFRGPNGQGHAPDVAPLEWSESSGVRWKTPIPGRGWSSPVVEGNQIWMTTAIEKTGDAAELKKRVQGMSTANAMDLAGEVSLRAVCVDRQTGQVVHDVELVHVEKPNPIHSLNSYASPTPVIQYGRLYGHFGRYGTQCIDTSTASVIWDREFPIEHFVGPGSSPVLCGNLLVLTCDGADKQFIVAVDKATGDTVWQQDRPPLRATNPDFRKSYCTPLVVEESGGPQIVIPGAQWIVAYAPSDGHEIWTFDHGSGFSVVPRPVVDDEQIYCCTGFGQSRLLAIRRGGKGDVTRSHMNWGHGKQVPTQPSPLLHDGKIYLVSDNGIGQCLDVSTGELQWKKRLPGTYSASPLKIGERIYYFNRDGLTSVIDLQAEGQVIASNQLEGRFMATPAVVEGEFIARTETHLYAIGE